jgi:hypothetical protein
MDDFFTHVPLSWIDVNNCDLTWLIVCYIIHYFIFSVLILSSLVLIVNLKVHTDQATFCWQHVANSVVNMYLSNWLKVDGYTSMLGGMTSKKFVACCLYLSFPIEMENIAQYGRCCQQILSFYIDFTLICTHVHISLSLVVIFNFLNYYSRS